MAYYTPINGINMSLVDSGAVAGTTNTFTTTANTVAVIDGKFASALASGSNQSITPTTDANTGTTFVAIPPNYAAAVVFGVNTAGSLKAVQGPLVATLAGSGNTVGSFDKAPQFPPLPDDFAPIAYTLIRSAPNLTAGFTVGSTSWAATGASCTTFKRVAALPSRPQTS